MGPATNKKQKVVASKPVPIPEPEPVVEEEEEEEEVLVQEGDASLSVVPVAAKIGKVPLNSKQFLDKLNKLANAVSDISVLETAINRLPKGDGLRYVNDVYIHRRDIASFRTTLKTEILDLRKDYQTALKYRKKLQPDTRRVVQFVRKLKPAAIELLCSAKSNLGPYNGKELHSQLPLFAKEGLLYNTTLMTLASIYTRKNKLASGENIDNTTYVKVLKPYKSELESRGLKFGNYNCTQWSTVWSVLKEDMSKEERVAITELHKEQLLAEEAIVTKVLSNLK